MVDVLVHRAGQRRGRRQEMGDRCHGRRRDARRPGVRECRDDRCRFHRRGRLVDRRVAAAVQGDGRRRRRHWRHAQDPRRRRLGGDLHAGRDQRPCASTFSISTCPTTGSRCARPSRATRRGCCVVRPGNGVRGRHRPRPARAARSRRSAGLQRHQGHSGAIERRAPARRRRGANRRDAAYADRAGSLESVHPASQAAGGRRPHQLRP